MKTSEIAVKYDIDQEDFDKYLVLCELNFTIGFWGGYNVDDADVEEYVKAYLDWNEERIRKEMDKKKDEEENKKRKEEEIKKKEEELERIMMTTGPSFEGYVITEYKGIIFDETITGVGLKTAVKGLGDVFASFTGEQMYALSERINELKRELIYRLKEKAVNAGANAIIGIDFENSIPVGSVIMVTAHGTAVVIEKREKTE